MNEQQFNGQISITQYLASIKAIPVASNILMPGQIVFLVDKCDISKHEVYGIYSVDEEESVVLITREGSDIPFITIAVADMDGYLFETEKAAKEKVLKALDECDCILASDMNILSFKSFVAQLKDGTILTAFYCQLDNGYIYLKDYYSCGHLLKISVEEAQEKLKEAVETYNVEAVPSENVPKLKNMYRTDPKVAYDWDYAERESLMCG